ncbi:unnamed protein product [Adineta steineri]|nr:unnamed protein product [Adineta steineri]
MKSTMISALNLLTKLLLTGEIFPVQTKSQLSNPTFLRCIFELIENHRDENELITILIKFLLSFNLRFDYPHENPIILTLVDINGEISCQELIERLILLFNRNIDPTEHKTINSIIKFFGDLCDDQVITNNMFLSDSNRRLIIEIISRELSNRSCSDEMTMGYLSLLELLLRNQIIISESCTRIDELQTCFRFYLNSENCLDDNRFIINEIIRQHKCLSTNEI